MAQSEVITWKSKEGTLIEGILFKPKERLAAVWYNWQWFGKYVFGEDIKILLD